MTNEWDQFPTASPVDVALQVEGITGKAADVARSIYQQESDSGKNTKTSNAGAVGGMQVIPATFNRMADKDWDIKDPIHNARAGVRYVKALYERSGGDPELTAAGYYGGEGGQDKARQGIAVSDPRNPKAPNTLQYAQQVADRLPKVQASEASAAAPDSWDAFPVVESPAKVDKPAVSPQAAPKRSMLDDLGRQLGLTVRAGISGVATIPAMAADAVTGPINAGLDAVAGKGNGFRFQKSGQALDKVMTAAGLPQPENATERVVQDAASSVAGAGGMVGAGKVLANAAGPVAQGVGNLLSAGPGLQITSAATGAGASGVVRENGGGAGAQIAAGVAGSLAPGFGAAAAKAAMRGALRGGEAGRQQVEKNITIFDQASGATPTLGQATESRAQRATESLLAKTPGGAGVMVDRAQKQMDDMAASVQRLSDELAPGANAANAGEAISRGVKAFKENVKTTQEKLYNALDQHIPAGTPITSAKTQAALADLNSDIAGAPALSKWFKNARIQGIEGGLKSDTTSMEAILSRPGMRQQADTLRKKLEEEAARITAVNAERRVLGMSNMEQVNTPAQITDEVGKFITAQADGNLPYESIKKLRTLVGRELADNSLVADVPRSKWAALYAALSDDLGEAAKSAGPKAQAAWDRANKYTRLSLERMDQLSGIITKDAPEKVFRAALSSTNEGDTVIKRVMNSLPNSERREVAAAVLQRLGRATAGQQNAMGDAFSSETFLTNISKLSPAARETLFGRTGNAGIQAEIQSMSQMAENIRKGSKVFSNPSGTAQAMTLASLLKAAGLALITGHPISAAAIATSPILPNVVARTVTSPSVVKFAAGQTALSEGAQAAAVGATTRMKGSEQPQPAAAPAATAKEWDAVAPASESMPQGAVVPPQAAPSTPALDGLQDLNPEQTDEQVNPTELPAGNSTAIPDQNTDMAVGQNGSGQDQSVSQDSFKVASTPPESTPQEQSTAARPDGTLALKGDPQEIRTMLVAAGIPERSLMLGRDGLVVGRTQANRVQEVIGEMLARAGTEQPAMDAAQALESGQNQAPAVDKTAPEAMNSVAPAETVQAVDNIDQAAHAAATSPLNDLPQPTQAQKEAGNYKVGRLRIAGMDISVENPQGSVRRGIDADGNPWETPMQHHYGYFRGTTGNDGDKLDVFVNPGTPEDYRGPVFVIDQIDPKTGKLDEHKVIFGAKDQTEAEAIYRSNYSADWNGLGAITRLPMQAFKAWAKSGTLKEPLGEIQTQAQSEDLATPDQTTVAGAGQSGYDAGTVQPDSTSAVRTASSQHAAVNPSAPVGSSEVDPYQHPTIEKIQRLHDAGETEVAELMKRSHAREQRLSMAPSELAAMHEVAPDLPYAQIPEFQQTYMQLRGAGTKPAEAAARAGILATVQSQGPAAGLSVKAIAALNAQLEILPLDKAPAFAQRFTEALIEKGGIAPFDGSDRIGSMLEQARDGAMHAMADAAYRENVA